MLIYFSFLWIIRNSNEMHLTALMLVYRGLWQVCCATAVSQTLVLYWKMFCFSFAETTYWDPDSADPELAANLTAIEKSAVFQTCGYMMQKRHAPIMPFKSLRRLKRCYKHKDSNKGVLRNSVDIERTDNVICLFLSCWSTFLPVSVCFGSRPK